jgi:hypothetical protein
VIEGAARGYAKLVDQKPKYNIGGIVASDPARDLVLLAVEGLKAAPLPIGNSNEVAVGDAVYAIGNPRGLEGTFSPGIVSSIRKIGEDSLLQITAPISPGSSGGPVVNEKGEVIGVAVATFKGGQNLNFAIPSRYLSALFSGMKAPVALPKAMDVRRGKKGRSLLDDLGTRSIDGVQGGQLLWKYSALQSGQYSFSLRNQLREHVSNVICLIVFYDKDGEPLEVDLIQHSDLIPAGLARRVTSSVDGSVQKLTTRSGANAPHTRVEFRMLYFDIVESGAPTD